MTQQNQACPQPGKPAGQIGANPGAHANVLVEWFGVRTALEMARFYAKDGPTGAYWSNVLATLMARFPQQQ
jgi:hypothetical protein